jgi:8-oxo-dGTP pyrophosphatase MutT (NUDIX family)
MRRLIEARLAGFRAAEDPLVRTLADVEGDVPTALLERLAGCQPAAVLLGLIERDAGFNVLFTQRSAHLSAHAGQVSFPGGRLEPSDAGPIEAALREATEEIGLDPALVRVVGRLHSFQTVTGFLITPVVGFVDPGFEPRPDETEVDAVFEVPLSFLLDPSNVSVGYRERMGVRFRVYEFHYEGRHIWGATASILMNLKEIITI